MKKQGGKYMINVGIVGATGYVGQQLLGFLLQDPGCNITFLSSHSYAGTYLSEIYGQYKGFIHKKCIRTQDVENFLSKTDLVFIALPHGKSFEITKKALDRGVKVIDMGADFRLENPDIYKEWYKLEHESMQLLSEAVYGLPELYREEIKGAHLIANPGCYPTASILGLHPLLKEKLIHPSSIIIDAKSGVSGAGRTTHTASLFCESNESIKAYGVEGHRHRPEIEQEVSKIYGDLIQVSFTPHLVPMNRGILTTCYGNLVKDISEEAIKGIYEKYYKEEYFIRFIEEIPQTRWVKGSNFCDISLRIDKRLGRITVISAIDNMIKGASGQAIQNMNLIFGRKETEGLERLSLFP